MSAMRDEPIKFTFWIWEDANWPRIRQVVSDVCWTEISSGDVHIQVDRINEVLLDFQWEYVPHYNETTKLTDQLSFITKCRIQAKKKSCLEKLFKDSYTHK